eukprot:m.130040 g.130040  ORF g.130040 m.130040 type:complete len:607 (+) comp13055_c2_seq2:3389-5209(+)
MTLHIFQETLNKNKSNIIPSTTTTTTHATEEKVHACEDENSDNNSSSSPSSSSSVTGWEEEHSGAYLNLENVSQLLELSAMDDVVEIFLDIKLEMNSFDVLLQAIRIMTECLKNTGILQENLSSSGVTDGMKRMQGFFIGKGVLHHIRDRVIPNLLKWWKNKANVEVGSLQPSPPSNPSSLESSIPTPSSNEISSTDDPTNKESKHSNNDVDADADETAENNETHDDDEIRTKPIDEQQDSFEKEWEKLVCMTFYFLRGMIRSAAPAINLVNSSCIRATMEMMDILRPWGTSESLVMLFRFVTAFTFTSSLNATNILHKGTKVLLSTLQDRLEDANIQQFGCSTLLNVGNYNQSAYRLISFGAEEVVLNIIEYHSQNTQVLASAAIALWSMQCSTDSACSDKAIDLLLRCAFAFPDHPSLQENICGALRNMAPVSDAKKQRIYESGFVSHGLNLIEKFLHVEDLVVQACGALRNIINGNDEYIASFFIQGGFEILELVFGCSSCSTSIASISCALLGTSLRFFSPNDQPTQSRESTDVLCRFERRVYLLLETFSSDTVRYQARVALIHFNSLLGPLFSANIPKVHLPLNFRMHDITRLNTTGEEFL